MRVRYYLSVIWYQMPQPPVSWLVSKICCEDICFELKALASDFDFRSAPGSFLPNQGLSSLNGMENPSCLSITGPWNTTLLHLGRGYWRSLCLFGFKTFSVVSTTLKLSCPLFQSAFHHNKELIQPGIRLWRPTYHLHTVICNWCSNSFSQWACSPRAPLAVSRYGRNHVNLYASKHKESFGMPSEAACGY